VTRRVGGAHTLVLYRASERADAALAELSRAADETEGRLTVVALATEEEVARGCCDTRSVLWNRVCRELAREDLAQARIAVDRVRNVELALLRHTARDSVEALVREAERRGASQIVVADPARCGLGRRERRRLRRRSPVPVVT
jgi:hypothetical protein